MQNTWMESWNVIIKLNQPENMNIVELVEYPKLGFLLFSQQEWDRTLTVEVPCWLTKMNKVLFSVTEILTSAG